MKTNKLVIFLGLMSLYTLSCSRSSTLSCEFIKYEFIIAQSDTTSLKYDLKVFKNKNSIKYLYWNNKDTFGFYKSVDSSKKCFYLTNGGKTKQEFIFVRNVIIGNILVGIYKNSSDNTIDGGKFIFFNDEMGIVRIIPDVWIASFQLAKKEGADAEEIRLIQDGLEMIKADSIVPLNNVEVPEVGQVPD